MAVGNEVPPSVVINFWSKAGFVNGLTSMQCKCNSEPDENMLPSTMFGSVGNGRITVQNLVSVDDEEVVEDMPDE